MTQNTIDFPDGLYGAVKLAATADRRSIKAEVVVLVEEALAARANRTAPGTGYDEVGDIGDLPCGRGSLTCSRPDRCLGCLPSDRVERAVMAEHALRDLLSIVAPLVENHGDYLTAHPSAWEICTAVRIARTGEFADGEKLHAALAEAYWRARAATGGHPSALVSDRSAYEEVRGLYFGTSEEPTA